MTLVRIGKVVINFNNVTTITEGPEPGSLIVRFVNEQTQTFTGDDVHALQAFLEKVVRTASKPLEDFVVS